MCVYLESEGPAVVALGLAADDEYSRLAYMTIPGHPEPKHTRMCEVRSLSMKVTGTTQCKPLTESRSDEETCGDIKVKEEVANKPR